MATSVLIIGASGRIGVECIRSLASLPSSPEIHAFTDDVSKLTPTDKLYCTSVIEGSARHAVDIREALCVTKACWIILSVGTGNDTSPTNVRAFTATNVVTVLQEPQFTRVRVIVISMARPVGIVSSFRLRHILLDHKGQEEALASLGDRVTIVRASPAPNSALLDCDCLPVHHRRKSCPPSYSVSILSEFPERISFKRSAQDMRMRRKSIPHNYLYENALKDSRTSGCRQPCTISNWRSELATWIAKYICQTDLDDKNICNESYRPLRTAELERQCDVNRMYVSDSHCG